MFEITTWADGFGVWHSKIIFKEGGAGNGPEGEALKERAMKAAKAAIRKEIVQREAPHKVRRLAYEIVANQEASTGQLLMLEFKEKF